MYIVTDPFSLDSLTDVLTQAKMGEIPDIVYIEMYSHRQEAHDVGFHSL